MKSSTKSLIRDSENSSENKGEQNYQIQPFQIKPKSLLHSQVKNMVDHWNNFQKIKQKFSFWSLNFSCQKVLKIVPQQFYRSAIHYVFLKKLQILIKDFDENEVIKESLSLKEIYKIESLKGKLKGKRFDYLMIVTVKLIGFFFGSHTREIIIDQKLQSQIYTILVFVILGAEVGEKTYHLLMDKYKKKPSLRYNRTSEKQILPTLLLQRKKPSQHHKTAKTTAQTKKRIGRTVCRTGTQLFKDPPKNEEESRFRQMKQLLRNNLQIKEFIPKPKVKESLDNVLKKTVDIDTKINDLDVAKATQKKQMNHKKIFYTQMSSSLDLLRKNNSLNILQNHSLNIKPEKQSKFYQLTKKQDLQAEIKPKYLSLQKLPKIQKMKQPEAYSYQANVLKKKQPTYWKKIVKEMKENRQENVEHFPPINMNIRLNQDQLDDQSRIRVHQNSLLADQNPNIEQDNYHGEYITEKVAQIPPVAKELQNTQLSSNTLSNFPEKQSKKNQKTTKSVLQDIKNQINVIEYSKVANESSIFKAEKSFLNVYSNKPLDDLNSKLKKKSYLQLKELQKKFYQDCKIRNQKIQQSYFS